MCLCGCNETYERKKCVRVAGGQRKGGRGERRVGEDGEDESEREKREGTMNGRQMVGEGRGEGRGKSGSLGVEKERQGEKRKREKEEQRGQKKIGRAKREEQGERLKERKRERQEERRENEKEILSITDCKIGQKNL